MNAIAITRRLNRRGMNEEVASCYKYDSSSFLHLILSLSVPEIILYFTNHSTSTLIPSPTHFITIVPILGHTSPCIFIIAPVHQRETEEGRGTHENYEWKLKVTAFHWKLNGGRPPVHHHPMMRRDAITCPRRRRLVEVFHYYYWAIIIIILLRHKNKI